MPEWLKPFDMNDANMALSESKQEGNRSSESIFCTREDLIYICLVTLVNIFFAHLRCLIDWQLV